MIKIRHYSLFFPFNFKIAMDNQQLLGLLGLCGDEKKTSSTTLVVHRPHPYVIALLSELPLTKKKRGTDESVEGQAWSFGAIHLFLDLYQKNYLAIGMGNMKKAYWLK
jgi:hypothetical protein